MIRPKIPPYRPNSQKFPVISLFNREIVRDEFARDCVHRQVYSIFQMVKKLRANLEHYANLDSRDRIANALQTPFPEARTSEASLDELPLGALYISVEA